MLAGPSSLEALVEEEGIPWTIQVIYPEDRNVESILADAETLISVESVQEATVEEEKKAPEETADTKPKKPCRESLPYANCWTPKGYTCPNCQKIYNARKNLARHINSECGKEPQYACPYCEYKNYRRNEIKKHAKNKHHLIFT
ncbi:hypothetical protein BDFB_000086 [Asbolus verrucosus]|uniref:C2H2-type domain-containing protein n=1 Tax=Asbolus verrucosus TaxID=1661398 RepID=A0A482V7M4_ASBVE|nr:hypothetical protein BDFB_000086 [Asbolus verrucosus]